MQKILGTLILCLLYCSTNFASEIKPFNKSGFIFKDGGKIKYIEIEHYPKMTEKTLNQIATTAKKKWKLTEVIILHRIGNIKIGDHIVLVSVWSAHRKEAFEGCRFIMEELKSNAPFWKKEKTSIGENWVEKNTSGI